MMMEKQFFKNTLEGIKIRPEMYVGSKQLKDILLYLGGVIDGHDACGGNDPEVIHYKKFDQFVQDELNEQSTNGWPSLIRNSCKDDDEAFERFVELLKKHREVLSR